MYHHYANQTIHNGYPQFFGIPTVTVPASAQETQKVTPSQGLFDSSVKPKCEKADKSEKGAGGNKKTDTSSFTIEERLVAAAWVHERYHTHTSMGQIKEQFELRFGRPAPAKNTLIVWERKLFSTGTVHDAPRAGRPAKRKLQAGEVSESLAAAPNLSVRARAAALAVPRTTLRALLRHLPPADKPPAKPKAARRRGAKPAPPPPEQPAAPTPTPAPAARAACDYYGQQQAMCYKKGHVGDNTTR